MYGLRKDNRSLCSNREIDYNANIGEQVNQISVAWNQSKTVHVTNMESLVRPVLIITEILITKAGNNKISNER